MQLTWQGLLYLSHWQFHITNNNITDTMQCSAGCSCRVCCVSSDRSSAPECPQCDGCLCLGPGPPITLWSILTSHILSKILNMPHLHVVVAVYHRVEAAVEDSGEIEEVLHPARHRGGSLLGDGVPVSDGVRNFLFLLIMNRKVFQFSRKNRY